MLEILSEENWGMLSPKRKYKQGKCRKKLRVGRAVGGLSQTITESGNIKPEEKCEDHVVHLFIHLFI